LGGKRNLSGEVIDDNYKPRGESMNCLVKLFAIVLLAPPLMAGAQADPCKLLTPAEMESALGVKPSGFARGSAPGGTLTCNGEAGKRMSVGLVLSIQKPGDPKIPDLMGWLENQSRQSAKMIGAQLDVKRFGSSILCTAMIPLKQGPFNTQCMAVKPTSMAMITVLVPAQQEMVSMDKLRPLAEKMAGRF
jgi:hypothetical protein